MAKIIESLFGVKNIPEDAKKILNDFDRIVQTSFAANSRQLLLLPKQIRELSHQMTDERSSRRLGYMNDKAYLASYIRYFMWWNLVRLIRLFSNLDFSFLHDGSVCLDVGSGPLTVVTALWLSHPELRQKKLVWYTLDISQQAINLGEELYLSVAAKTLPSPEASPWQIMRVRGELGTPVKQKVDFITAANVFNEILQSKTEPPDFLAKKYSQSLFKYLDEEASILLIEPGVPKSARFISLMRDAFLRKGFSIVAPCPHAEYCPMDGRRQGQKGANGKWCNFAFDTDDAPKRLLSLSKSAGIPKERAVLSFVLAGQTPLGKQKDSETESPAHDGGEKFRIVSDVIWLPGYTPDGKRRAGHYACAARGFTLAVNGTGTCVDSGDLVELDKKTPASRQQYDAKTGAVIVEI